MNKNYDKVITLLMGLLILLSTFALVGMAGDDNFKTLVFGLQGKPVTFDPANHRSRYVTSVSINWTDALAISLPDGRQLPNVAESITLIDPLTYEIKIREGIHFHNGDPLTADDVMFTFKRFWEEGGMEGKTSPRRSLFDVLKSVEKIDDYTIRANLEVEDSSSPIQWVFAEILPKKYFEEVGVDAFIQHPIGCGPFKFVEGDLNTQVVLDRYDGYWGGNPEYPGEVERVPAVDRIIIKYIKEPTTRIAALLAGEVDIIKRVSIDMIPLLENNPDIKVVSGPGTSIRMLALNSTRPPFNDVRIRKAVAHAIDYKKIVEELYLGRSYLLGGIPTSPPVKGSPYEEYYNRLRPFEYSPEKAKALLEEAGATDILLVLDTIAEYTEEAQVVAQMLSDVGIDTSVRVWEKAVINELMKAGKRNAFFYSAGNAEMSPTMFPKNFALTGQPLNYGNYSSPVFDDLISRIFALPESKEKNELIFELHEFVQEEVPYITLHVPYIVEATRSNVINYTTHYQDRDYLHHVDLK